MLINKNELNNYFWKQKDEIFDDLAKYGVEQNDLGTSGIRIQPCICGHFNCCTAGEVDEVPMVHCFSCNDSSNFSNFIIKIYKAKGIDPIPHLEKLLDVKVVFSNKEDESKDRIAEIREIAAVFYNEQLLDSKVALEYESVKRQVSMENLKKFKMGYAADKFELRQRLNNLGYSEDEIKQSKVMSIYEGLIIFPYYLNGKVTRFNTKNPFKVKDKNGDEIKGFSIGEKIFYSIPEYDYADEVFIVEGEHDLITCYQHGIKNVLATGGSLKDEQIESLRKLKSLYVFTDNDSAGRKYVETLNEKLPEVKIFDVQYENEFKDPDEYFKLCQKPLNIEELKKSAVELKNDKYKIYIEDDVVFIRNREYSIEFYLKSLDNKGKYSGDFVYYKDNKEEEIKLDVNVGSLSKKYMEFIIPIKNAIDNIYNEDFDKKSIQTLLNSINFSNKKSDVIKAVADKISSLDDKEKESVISDIEKYHVNYKEKILEEMTIISNSKLDPDVNYPIMPASQAFDINNNRAYMYFNRTVRNDDGILVLPCLLSSDKRIIRLDLYKRKTDQHLLIIDGAFQLQGEILTALMSNETCSLKTKYVNKYINGEITKDMVKPDVILVEMEEYYKKVFYSEDDVFYKILALFTYSTYLYQLFGATSYLLLNAQKGSGKSLLSNVLSMLCSNARFTVGATEAALFRTVSLCGGTMILDEMENITTRDKTTDSLMASILKAGYTKDSGNTLRTNMETKSIEEFSVFCPKIISNIFGVDDVISDRCITLNLKKHPAEKLNSIMNIEVFKNTFKDKVEETTSKAAISALCYFEELYTKYVANNLVRGTARNTQILRPLYAIAATTESIHYTSALDYYYNNYMIKEKLMTEASSPEGYLKSAVKILINELFGNYKKEWINDPFVMKYCHLIDSNKFRTNTLCLKIIIDSLDAGKCYSMNEVHKIIKRVFPTMEFGRRTSVSIITDENLMKRMRNQTKVSTYELDFLVDEFIDNLAKTKLESTYETELF